MNHCAVQQNALAACDEMRSPFSIICDRGGPVFCPKPRRLGRLSGSDPIRSLRWQLGHQAEPCDSKPSAEILDIILAKSAYGDVEQYPSAGESPVASPPFFCGSPPSRSTNPLVLDARFGDEKVTNPLPALPPSFSAGGAAAARKGCVVRANFGPKPAAVRIEGFDCLDRDSRRGSCGITAVA